MRVTSWLYLKWIVPFAIASAMGLVIAGSLYWSGTTANTVAADRQKDLLSTVVSKMHASIAHDQESATVWDDAVIKTNERDIEWIGGNLGEWMNTYFGHDAAIVLSSGGAAIYQYIAENKNAPSPGELSQAYQPLADLLRARLAAEDQSGISDRVLSIGESDLRFVGKRPAIVSVKPIVSDTGDIEQSPEAINMHVAVRYLDGTFPQEIGAEYSFADMNFSTIRSQEAGFSRIELTSREGNVVGYFNWRPFEPGTSVFRQTMPVIAASLLAIFMAASLAGHSIWRRSLRLDASKQKLEYLALHDSLTGLANRAYFERELKDRLASSGTADLRSVLFIDLDRFKAVNDTYGHPTGDKLITQTAHRMKAIVPDALIARLGGDEFTILLEVNDEKAVQDVATSLVKALREPFEIDGKHILVGASVGAAIVRGAGDGVEAMRQADIALYHSKAAGRNTFALFGDHMDELLRNRRVMERDLRVALETNTDLEVVYQPVFASEGEKPCSLEALSRWTHPQFGKVAPDVFIPLAEEIGLIHIVGNRVLEDACQLMARLPELGISINASATELAQGGYGLRVLSTLAKWNIDARRLEIEITESLAISGEGTTDHNIATLRAAGVRFAIDDFGTGYSSFSRVQRVLVDRIKIDKSFINAIHEERSRSLVAAMIHMAQGQGMATTAEGVETAEQRDMLIALGCNHFQGFLLSQPVSGQEIISIMRGSEDAISI